MSSEFSQKYLGKGKNTKKRNKMILTFTLLIISFLCMCFLCFAFIYTENNKKAITSSATQPASSGVTLSSQEETTDSSYGLKEASNTDSPVTINVMMIGDMLIHRGVYRSGTTDNVNYNFDHLFANILDDIEEADMRIVNQETILGGTEMGLDEYPNFNSPQEIGDAEVEAGFNIIPTTLLTRGLPVLTPQCLTGRLTIRRCLFWESMTPRRMQMKYMSMRRKDLR